ncbi:MAG: substrate-binding domain-containing protein [Gammaproteobacteria bacterium]|nr:substrate-binding domain-containing protein [Gammaproteobacteria bacterium]
MFKCICLLFVLIVSPLAEASENDKKVIAFAQDTMANDFRKAQVFEVRDEAAKYPEISFVYSDGQGQTSLMIRQIEQFIAQKVDLLIIGTNDENAVVPVVSKAYKSGIPVIVLDRGIKGNDYTTFINSDNIKIGRLGAEFVAQELNGKGVVLLFEGIQEADVTQLRSQGFIDEISKYKEIQVIKRTGNYLRKDAVIEMEKLLKQGVHIDAIFSESDSMLSGVRMVLKRYKIDPSSIVMVGVDYISEAQQAIRNGNQSASILFPLGGTATINNALKIFNGEMVPRHIYNPVELVTKKNVEEITPIF